MWSVATVPGPAKPAPGGPQRMLSAMRACACAQSVCTSASGVPPSVTWRASSRAAAAPQRTRSTAPLERWTIEDSTRGVPSTASTPLRTSAARSAAAPRSAADPTTSTRSAVPVRARPLTVASATVEAGSESVRPPSSSVTPAPDPAMSSRRPASSSAAVARTSPSSIRSPSTASSKAAAAVSRGSQPARVKPTQ